MGWIEREDGVEERRRGRAGRERVQDENQRKELEVKVRVAGDGHLMGVTKQKWQKPKTEIGHTVMDRRCAAPPAVGRLRPRASRLLGQAGHRQ